MINIKESIKPYHFFLLFFVLGALTVSNTVMYKLLMNERSSSEYILDQWGSCVSELANAEKPKSMEKIGLYCELDIDGDCKGVYMRYSTGQFQKYEEGK